jgi:hypothetical protein
VPSSDNSRPLLPKFFLEAVCGCEESFINVRSKVIEDLAYARGMHKIQSYGQGLDGNAYTIGSILLLQHIPVVCHAPTGPAGPNGEPSYWID